MAEIQGSIIERCIEFCGEFDAGFTAAIAGAMPEQISEIERLVPRPLSAPFREFLARLSERHAWLDFGLFSTRAEDLIGQRNLTLALLQEAVELIAVDTTDLARDLFLIHDGGPDPAVVSHPVLQYVETGGYHRDQEGSVAGSLSELICLQALNRHYSLRQPLQVSYVEKGRCPGTLDRCRAIGERLGFEPYWFSSAQAYVARKGTLVVIGKQARNALFTVGIAGDEQPGWSDVSRALGEELDLELLTV